MEKLRVEISGDSKKLEQATDKAIKELKQFEKVAEKSIGGIAKPAAKGAKGIKTLGGASANATPALLEFNRTIQDAPFGIQGVANNIQQLTANFGFLKQKTGSTKNALKAMLAGLSGPQGILLAVSAITSLLVVFGDQLLNTKSDAEKLADATKKATEALDEYVKSLDDVSKARLKGNQDAQKQLLTLSQLRTVVEDTTRSTVDRKKALQELRRLFPDYFKDLKDENILTGTLTGVYDKLTKSILARARSTAATGLIIKNTKTQLELEARRANLQETANKKELAFAKAQQKFRDSGEDSRFLRAQSLAFIERQKALDEVKKVVTEISKIDLRNIDLSKLVDENGGIDLSKVKLPKGETVTLRPNVDIIAEEIGKFEIPNLVNRGSLGKDIDDALVGPLLELPNKIDIAATQALIALNNFNEEASRIVQGSLADTFGQLGAVIGDALVSGGNVLEAVGTTLLQGIGNFLSRMGQLLIEYGTLAVIKGKLDLAILTGGPAAIGAGLIAIAVGTALTAAGSAFSGIASGNSSGGVSSGGSSSSGSFSSSSGGFGGGNVVFEISGRNLVGVLKRNTDSNLAING